MIDIPVDYFWLWLFLSFGDVTHCLPHQFDGSVNEISIFLHIITFLKVVELSTAVINHYLWYVLCNLSLMKATMANVCNFSHCGCVPV